ncbi:protein translocase subunit SecD [Tundrisphaera lichenicola]|uniref:protein translocase subunit SecD n=1 Tax=Tundrisphaera lichenicola TaxID=2029860 RepID=UPI003EB97CCA
MKKFGGKFALIIGLTLLGLVAILPPKEKLKTGIDLSGGTILVYEVRKDATAGNVSLDELITALKRRVNPEGVLDIPIRAVGNNRIEVILPKATADEVEEVKRKMTNVGSLEFRILANHKHDAAVIDRALGSNGFTKPPSRYKWAMVGETITGSNPTRDSQGKTLTDPTQRWVKNAYAGRTAFLTGKTEAGIEQSDLEATIEGNTLNTLTFQKPLTLASVSSYRIEFNPSRIQPPNPTSPDPAEPIIREEKVGPGHTVRYVLYKIDRQDVTGKLLAKAEVQQDDHYQPAVGFTFNRQGGRKFGTLTSEHLPEENGNFKYRLAILLDGVVQSAPSINSEIRDSGIIEGGASGFSQKELNFLITVLRSGSLPASLNPEPLQEESVGPTLGDDTIAKGVYAIIVSMLVVCLFMIAYYRFAGLVAVVALMLNLLLLLASMAFLQASFTLPGLAGLALTIGMAVDVNVLIFERMREEADRGAGLAQQIRNGFNRAWVTIFDSHVTIFLSGLVLYTVGTDEVKGFALTLIIGMVWNLFTAVYVSRVIFEFWYAKGWLKRVTMLKLMDKTNIDFISPRKACMAVSTLLIVLGLVATGIRGKGMYNIDFTGGTLVTIQLNDQDPDVSKLSNSERTAFVRSKASELPDVTVESLTVGGEKSGERYNIRTTEQKIETVKQVVLDSFKNALQRVELKPGAATPIAATPAVAPTDPAKEQEAAVDRFAGGRQYELNFNLPQSAPQISTSFRNVLQENGINNPDARFEIVNPKATSGNVLVANSETLLLRTNLEPEVVQSQLEKLTTSLRNDRNLLFERSESFGSTVAAETRSLAVVATVASWIIIAVYLWFRFKSLVYGLAAIIAVVHDVLITLGAIAVTYWLSRIPILGEMLLLEPFKIDLPMIAAFLTLIGFSVNDTIVIFDRIRELKGKSPHLSSQMINDAVNQTLSRTILTSLTAWLVVIILYLFGGEGLHGFAFSLVVGFLSGTYSTIYIASPILIDWDRRVVDEPIKGKELVGSR